MSLVMCSVQNEYKKDSKIKIEDVNTIREWLNEERHLPVEYITDLDIILAYHSCNYNVEKAKVVIDLNFTLRTLFAFYQSREVNRRLENAMKSWLMTPLATLTKKGNRTIYCQLLDPDPDLFVYEDVVRAFVMIIDLWLYGEGTSPGVAFVINMENVALAHITRIDPAVAQQFFYFLQEAMFVRLKEFHFFNAPSFIGKLLSLIRPFMKQGMLDMVKVHPVGVCTLQDYIPINALPKENGGCYKNIGEISDEMWKKMKANVSFFEQDRLKTVEESRRAGPAKTISTFFSGIETSFKKLELD